MHTLRSNEHLVIACTFILLALHPSYSQAQNWQQVWGDEFNEPTIDRSVWAFDSGPVNDTVHFFTDRSANAHTENGTLRIIALEESYQGFRYTAALLSTKHSASWRYGRIEARIKLPGTNGFVPAFWMMPADDRYGWWPWSGEIDILEHPSNQVDKIYGTVHTAAFNAFTGSAPRGSQIRIPDAETAFHLYAIEWTADKLDFFVDDQKYFTFYNDHLGSDTWPFDQPFYIILSMGVGGGWVGNPDATSVFPAVMEVDYVRVYQQVRDVTMQGADFVRYHSPALPYSVPAIDGAGYIWSVPGDATLVSDPNEHQIAVDWGVLGGNVTAEIITPDEATIVDYPVKVSSNLIKNAGFEKGVKYWTKSGPYPAQADFTLTTEMVHTGDHSLFVDVITPGVQAWDAQLSQGSLTLSEGMHYHASFWARTAGLNHDASAAIINSADYTLYAIKPVTLTPQWKQYDLTLTAPSEAVVSFNLDLGGHTGQYYFDDFVLTTSALSGQTQITNGDFVDADAGWNFNTFAPAQATGVVAHGEYAVKIHNGGTNVWDINVGQAGLLIEKGKQYDLMFDAYATVPRQIFVLVGKNAQPWNVYNGNIAVALTTTKKTYTYSFTMNDPTDKLARLGFDLGGSSSDVFLDNVTLKQVTGRTTDY